MVRRINNPDAPYLFPDMEEERHLNAINRRLTEASFEDKRRNFNTESFPPRKNEHTAHIPATDESLLFAIIKLKPAYNEDPRVPKERTAASFISDEAKTAYEAKRELAMIATFSFDLAIDPFHTVLRLASHELMFRSAFTTVPLIYYIAQNDPECKRSIGYIREGIAQFVSQYSSNPKEFITSNRLNWNSTKELAQYFSANQL